MPARSDRGASPARPHRPPDAGRGSGSRRPDGPDRGVPRPGGRDRAGRAHPLRREAAPGPEARRSRRGCGSGSGSRSPASTATTAFWSGCRRSDEPPLDLFEGLTGERAEELIREELGDSALFGLRFRQNAGRALLMPRPDPAKRTPLWLQRLRAKDLLQVVRRFPDFPIVVETYRECLNDDLDLPRLRAFLDGIEFGSHPGRRSARRDPLAVRVGPDLPVHVRSTSTIGTSRAGRSAAEPLRRRRRIARPPARPGTHALWLDPTAIGRVESRLRGIGHPPRTIDEMAETLRRLGDLAPSELAGPMLGFLVELETRGSGHDDRSGRDGRTVAMDQHGGGPALCVGVRACRLRIDLRMH